MLLLIDVTTLARVAVLVGIAALAATIQGLLTGPVDIDGRADPWGVAAATAVLWEGTIWVDARPEAAYLESHYAGSVHADPDNLDEALSEVLMRWDPGDRVVIYCDGNGCESSRSLAEQLRQAMGPDTKIYWLRGGWESLREELSE